MRRLQSWLLLLAAAGCWGSKSFVPPSSWWSLS
jgi:hypothetical protein